MKLSEINKSEADTKRKEQAFGLANNAFGATAGAVGTRAVYREARAKRLPGREAKYQAKKIAGQQKVSDKAAARYAAGKHPFGPIKRASQAIGSKIPQPVKRYAAPAGVAGAVGMQLVNSAADAQSAAYFSRELASKKPKAVAKAFSDQNKVGYRIVEVSKRRFDSEADRQHRLGVYEGLGATGTIAGTAGGVVGLKRQGVRLGNVKRKLLKHKLPLAGLAATGASTGVAVGARRAYTRDRNESWS